MRVKNFLKFSLSFSGMTAIFIPIATLVSCGNTETIKEVIKEVVIEVEKKDTIDISGVEEVTIAAKLGNNHLRYREYAKHFEELTGVKVSFIDIQNMNVKNEFIPAYEGGNLHITEFPMLNIIGKELLINEIDSLDPMFEFFNLDDLGAPKYSLRTDRKSNKVKTDDDFQVEFGGEELNFNSSLSFNQPLFQSVLKHGSSREVFGLPIGYTSSMNWINWNAIDTSKKLKIVIPQIDGAPLEFETNIRLTDDGIQSFLASSDSAETYISNTIDSTLPDNIKESLHKNGPLALFQRIGSLSSILKDGYNVFSKDMNLEWDVISSIDTLYDSTNHRLDINTLNSKFMNNEVQENFGKTLWEGYYGYYGLEKGFVDNDMLNEEYDIHIGGGQFEKLSSDIAPFMNGKAAFFHDSLDNLMWDMSPMMNPSIAAKAMPKSFSSVDMAAIAMGKGLTEQQQNVAKLFIRFIFNQDTIYNERYGENKLNELTLQNATVDGFAQLQNYNADISFQRSKYESVIGSSTAQMFPSYTEWSQASIATGKKVRRMPGANTGSYYQYTTITSDPINDLGSLYIERSSDNNTFNTLKTKFHSSKSSYWGSNETNENKVNGFNYNAFKTIINSIKSN